MVAKQLVRASTWARRIAVTAAGAVILYLPTLGLPLADRCLNSATTAWATPSPSCSSDLRACLRKSADLRQTTFGGRYVTAEDVSRCMEIFNGCIHGAAGGGGGSQEPPKSTQADGGTRKGLPKHLGISFNNAVAIDCRVTGSSMNCSYVEPEPVQGFDSWTGGFTGTLSGTTVTGTKKIHIEGYVPGEPSCRFTQEGTGSATAAFNADGTVTMQEGPFHWQKTFRGSCSGDESNTIPASEWTAPWSAIG